jgi:hypothetical protein
MARNTKATQFLKKRRVQHLIQACKHAGGERAVEVQANADVTKEPIGA